MSSPVDDARTLLFSLIESGAIDGEQFDGINAGLDALEAENKRLTTLATPRTQLTNVISALCWLIHEWNETAADEDQGRDHAALCFTLWEDGSGRLGTFDEYDTDDGAFATLTMNIQSGYNTADQLIEDLLKWVEHSEVWREGSDGH